MTGNNGWKIIRKSKDDEMETGKMHGCFGCNLGAESVGLGLGMYCTIIPQGLRSGEYR